MKTTDISTSQRASMCSELLFSPSLWISPSETGIYMHNFYIYQLRSLRLAELLKQKQNFNGINFCNLLACTDSISIPNSIHDFISSAKKLYLSVLVSEEGKVKDHD